MRSAGCVGENGPEQALFTWSGAEDLHHSYLSGPIDLGGTIFPVNSVVQMRL